MKIIALNSVFIDINDTAIYDNLHDVPDNIADRCFKVNYGAYRNWSHELEIVDVVCKRMITFCMDLSSQPAHFNGFTHLFPTKN